MSLESILQQVEEREHLARQRASWNPQSSGRIDIRIDRSGNWHHQGSPIHRQGLVRLLADILRREEDGGYYLVTPVEKWQIQVDDLPFLAVDLETLPAEPFPRLLFTTNLGERVVADRNHPIVVETDLRSGEPRPAIDMFSGLAARINRPTFYRLVDLAMGQSEDHEQGALWIHSGSERFCIGQM